MDMMAIRRSIMQGRQLPPGYQRVEYISGTGTQYIDSGIACTSDLGIDFSFEISTSVNAALCGGIDTRSPMFRHHGSPYSFGEGDNYMYNFSVSGYVIPVSISPPQLNTRYRIRLDPSIGTYDISGDNYSASGTFTPPAYKSTGRNYGILARISQTGAIQSRPSKIFYFKFWRGGKMIGDFVPCYRKTDSVAGMYDLVTNVFFTNAGSGTFGVGPDV